MKRIIIFLLAVLSATAFADVEIIVTASRIEEDSKTTPAYVRVIPEEEIQKELSILDVLKTIPDISIRETSPAKQSISMGGFGENGFGRTLVLINGRPVNRPDMSSFDWNSITLSSVSRIEIIKGAMSSQYGDQAVAGVVNIITKQPEGLIATASASVADTLSNNQSVIVSYGNKTTGFALGLNRTDNNPTRDRSDSTILSANLDSYYNLSDLKVKVGGYYSNSEYQLPGSLSKAQFDVDPDKANNLADEGISTSYGANASFDFAVGSFDISIPVSYSVLDYNSDMASWWPSGDYSDTSIAKVTTGIKSNTSFYLGDSIEITPVSGIDFKQNNLSITKFDSAVRTTQTSETEVKRIDAAAWARAKANYLDTFIFDSGLRYGYSLLDTDPSIVHTPLVYDMGVVWLPSSDLRFSIKYGRVFRYPLLEEQYESGYTVLNVNLVPETGHNFTASIDFTKNNFRVTVAPYLISMEDEIAYVGSFPTGKNENIGSTLHYGASVESVYSKEKFDLNAGYSYDHAEFTDTGKIIPLVPEHTVYGSISVKPVQPVTISTDARYTSSFFEGGDNVNAQDPIPGRTCWNIRIDWRMTNNISGYIKTDNILNNRTPTSIYYGGWYPMPGRTFETGMKWVY